MPQEDTLSTVQRAAVYGLLGRLWDREIDQRTLDALQSGALRDAYQAVGGYVPDEKSASLLESLAVDFCQLFVGPRNHVVPCQSVYSEGRLEGEASAGMKAYLELIGRQSITLRSPLDHFANQLTVMQRGMQSGLPAATVKYFFQNHVLWAEALCQRVMARSETDFYRALAQVTSEFLRLERAAFHEPSPSVS